MLQSTLLIQTLCLGSFLQLCLAQQQAVPFIPAHVYSKNASDLGWNFTEWYNNFQSGFSCDEESIKQVTTAYILNFFDVQSKPANNRSESCKSLEASLLLNSNISRQCKKQESQLNLWDSSAHSTIFHYSHIMHINEFATMYRLVCSASTMGNRLDEDIIEMEIEGNEGAQCDMDMIRDSMLTFFFLQFNLEDIKVCRDITQAVETTALKLSSCGWEIYSPLSLLLSSMKNMKNIICTPPTCNVEYASLCLSNAELIWHTHELNITTNLTLSMMNITQSLNNSDLASSRASICRNLKLGIACVTNHTVDCQSSIYNSISSRFDLLNGIFKQICPEYVQAPSGCLVMQAEMGSQIKPNVSNIAKIMSSSFIFNTSDICWAITNNNGSQDLLENFCPGLNCACNMTLAKTLLMKNSLDCVFNTLDIVNSLRGCSSMEKNNFLNDSSLLSLQSCIFLKDIILNVPSCETQCPTFEQLKQKCSPINDSYCQSDSMNCFSNASLGCSKSDQASLLYGIISLVSTSCANKTMTKTVLQSSLIPVFNITSEKIIVNECLGYLKESDSSLLSETIQNILDCLNDFETKDEKQMKVENFLNYLKKNLLPVTQACANDEKLKGLLYNSTKSILTGSVDVFACHNAPSIIDMWSSSCSQQLNLKGNVTAIFSLVCQREIQQTNCSIDDVYSCFYYQTRNQTQLQYLQTLQTCIKSAVINCKGSLPEEFINLASNLTLAFGYNSSSLNKSRTITNTTGICTCDPAAAINCIMDVHHMAKQPVPDYEGICPLVSASKDCAERNVASCDECQRLTVVSIVNKLNSKLEEVCMEPPVTLCQASRAMNCIKDLSSFQNRSNLFDNSSKCVQITLTLDCVYESTKNCDDLTSLSIRRNLEQVIHQWKSLRCNDTEDQLVSCLDIFQSKVYSVVGYDVSLLDMNQENSTLWTKVSSLCEEVVASWSCVSASLNLQTENIKNKIMKKSFKALYTALEQICKPRRAPLQCYSCQGEGTKSCAEGADIETCKDNHVCETVTEVGRPKSRGCKPQPSCKPGCYKDKCTYCCPDNLCNDLDNGPLDGFCNMTSLASCVLDLSSEYIQRKEIQCSSASTALDCIYKHEAECKLGGKKTFISALATLNISSELTVCLIQEANQTCDVGPVGTTAILIAANGFSMSQDDLCKIVNESRARVAQAEAFCIEDQVKELKQAHLSLESMIGHLNCTEKFQFVIEDNCRPLDALNCFTTVFSADNVPLMNDYSCTLFNETTKCVQNAVKSCTSACQLVQVNSKMELLKSYYSQVCYTDVKVTQTNLTEIEIAQCISSFTESLRSNQSIQNDVTFSQVITKLQTCFMTIENDTFVETSYINKFVLEIIFNLIEALQEFDLTVNVPYTCEQSLNTLIMHHGERVFTMPFLPLSQREYVCGEFDNQQIIQAVVTNCNSSLISEHYKAVDIMRDSIISFCPDIKPIPRCLISRAEECLSRLTARITVSSDDGLCKEAHEMITCAVDYTQFCNYEEVISFRRQTVVISDIVTQTCSDDIELISKVRCSLLGRIDVQPGCNSSPSSVCNYTDLKDCRNAEKQAACIIQAVGSCPNAIIKGNLTEPVSRIAECRYGDPNASLSLSTCSKPAYKCDISMAEKCLNMLSLFDLTSESSGDYFHAAKECLEENYYCFSSVLGLLNTSTSYYIKVMEHILSITPNWEKLESKQLIWILVSPSYISSLLNQKLYVSLNLWDVYQRLYTIYLYIQETQIHYVDMYFDVITQLTIKLQNILNYISVDIDQNIELPERESPQCPSAQIKAELDLLLSRSLTEIYTPHQLANLSLCRLYSSLQEKLDAQLVLSCSPAFIVQAKFTLKVCQTFIGDVCQVSEVVQRRCDIKMVEQCVNTLYKNIQNLGINQTVIGLCQLVEETDACVERFSYKCDKCSLSRIFSMYKSIRQSAVVKCTTEEEVLASCQEDIAYEEQSPKCDVKKASKCAFKQMKEIAKIFKKSKDKCKVLSENLECVQKYTLNCEARIVPKLSLLNTKFVESLKKKYGCVDRTDTKPNLGCRPGCWMNETKKCFDIFYRYVPKSAKVNLNKDTCKYINELKICISLNTTQCTNEESKKISVMLDAALEKLLGHEAICTDGLKCVQEFNSLVRRLHNLQPDEYISYNETAQSQDSGSASEDTTQSLDGTSSDDEAEDITENSPFNLNSVCVQATAAWKCLQKSLLSMPAEKRKVLSSIYGKIWEFVEDKCADTREFSCYYCKNGQSPEDCTRTEICPMNKRACMLKQIFIGKDIKYKAGCTPVSSCKNKVAGNQRTTCCTADQCNSVNQSITAVVQESSQCQLSNAINCGLAFTNNFWKSENDICSNSAAYLGCMIKYASNCTQGKGLVEASNQVYLYLAKYKCVIDATDDCYSLAINSMQTFLSNPYNIQGNTPCLVLNETTYSVKEIIASGRCTESGQISLKQNLEFLSAVVLSYCRKDKCSDSSIGVLNEADNCTEEIFSGINHIYKGYEQLAKGSELLHCGECANSARRARQILKCFNISKFVLNKLDYLDTEVQKKCSINPQVQLQEVCTTVCQEDKLITFVDGIARNISLLARKDFQCWYVSQVTEAYKVYTSGCSSIQQKDAANYILYSLVDYIKYCRISYSDFQIEFELKVDIYSSIANCQMTFQEEIQTAFLENSQEKTCSAFTKLKTCNWSAPKMFEDFIFGPTKQLIEAIEAANICAYIGNDRTKRETSVCQLEKLSAVIKHLSIPPHIASTPLDCRNKFCRQMDNILEEANLLFVECGDSLSLFQRTLFRTFYNNFKTEKDRLCPSTHYEEEKCDLEIIVSCRKDFESVSLYASIGQDTLCRQAKFALECTERFSKNCSTSNDIEKAQNIQLETKMLIKLAVGNTCDFLTTHLYCNDSLATIEPACRLDEAKKCMAQSDFDFTKSNDPIFCQYLQNNVSCVQKAMTGCQGNQIKALGWASKTVQGVCSIEDVTLNNVCVSTPLCSSKAIIDCFTSKPNDCLSMQKAVSCVNTILASNKLCLESWGVFIVRNFLSTYYGKLYQKCSLDINVTLPQLYASSCLSSLLKDVELILITKYRTRNQVFHYFMSRLVTCLESKERIDPIISMLLDISIELNAFIPKDITVTYNTSTDQQFTDTDTCYYSQAKACLSRQIFFVISVKLLNGEERNDLCDLYAQNSIQVCVEQALSQCAADKGWFLGINTFINEVISSLQICDSPQLCIVSEAFECSNKLAAIMSKYDQTKDKDTLCQERLKYQDCLNSFVSKCSDIEAKSARDAFTVLYNKVDSICKDIELPPPPICPQIPERNRECNPINAFHCMANFYTKMLGTGDSLIWHLQCLNIQSMIVCVATNTTSCDSDSADVKAMIHALDEFRLTADAQCPWLSDDLCTKENICPVVTAGCEVELEHGLINQERTVCELKQRADECVAKNTVTCNKAQRNQAVSVIEKKLQTVGLPKDLSCENNSFDGCLYSLLSAARSIQSESQKNDSCSMISSQYKCIETRISNPTNSTYVDLGRKLLAELYRKLNSSYCTGLNVTNCTQRLDVQKLALLISQLLLTKDFHNTSFCAQSIAIIEEFKSNECYGNFAEIIKNATSFKQKCVSELISCSEAEVKIQRCIQGFASLQCFNNIAALCITNNLPSNCEFKRDWISQNLCQDTVVLMNSGSQRVKNFISEDGLSATFKWKLVAGSRYFKIIMTSQAVNNSATPRCLDASKGSEPIPQIYTDLNPKLLSNDSTEIQFNIYARQDYKKDDPISVNVIFTVIPCEVVNGSLQEVKNSSFVLSTYRVEVDDRDVKRALCTVVNDPHIVTFDGIKYNNMRSGKFLLYGHAKYAVAVIAQFQKCAIYGTCTCGIEMFVGRNKLTLSKCSATQFITYETLKGPITADHQELRFYSDNDRNTYTVILLPTQTVVKVVVQEPYMNVMITPSGNDYGYTRGQCGLYDGDGYNDFHMPDSSVYKVVETDNQFNVLTPMGFNMAWEITNSSDLSSVYAPGVVISDATVPTYCYGWMDSPICSTSGHVETCGFATGEDQTEKLLEMLNQVQSSGSMRRKRQATTTQEEFTTNTTNEPGWPTSTGWTLENATLYCLENLFNKPLQACRDAVLAIDATMKTLNFDDPVQTCVDDIRLSGGTLWIEGARLAASQLCMVEINHNPDYQKTSNDLAMTFLNLTCTPYNCNNHGTCNKGQCICSSGYYGTGCNLTISQLDPPILEVFEENVHLCEISETSDCSAVYLSGSGFISSALLSCHIRESIEGQTRSSIVSATLLSKDLVRCNLGIKSAVKRLLQISVSNDGKKPDPNYQNYLAYDPLCYSCTRLSCKKNLDVCFIGTKCVAEGAQSVYNDCEYCDLKNPNKWSIYKDVPGCKEETTNKQDNETPVLTTALIAVGVTLLFMLIVLIVALFIYVKRRAAAKKREALSAHRYTNQAYQDNPPFYGQPILAHNTKTDSVRQLLGSNDAQSA